MDDSTQDSNPSVPTEEMIQSWIGRIKDGDLEAFQWIVKAFALPLQTIIYRILLDWEESRDVEQEAFLQAFQALPKYQSRGKFQSWLFQIGVRKALDFLRRKKRRPEVSNEDFEKMDPGTEDSHVSRNEISKAIEQAVQTLSHEQRISFVLSEYEGSSHAEIADTLKISPKSVEMHLYRARDLLRQRLRRFIEKD